MLNKLYVALGTFLLLGYSYAAVTGWEPGGEDRQFVPASARAARHSPGGYYHGSRSYHFWSWNFRGGK